MYSMENTNFLSYTVKKNILVAGNPLETNQQINIHINSNTVSNVGCLETVSQINVSDTVLLNGEDVNLFGVVSDERLDEIYSNTSAVPNTPVVKLSTTYKDFSPSETARIKELIYNLHNGIGAGSGGDGTGGDGTTPEPTKPSAPPTPPPTDPSKVSFISEFNDTVSMFEYLNGINSEISYSTGITRAQLTAITQNDDWEDANHDFFGQLNWIFDSLDKDDNSTLSAAEIEAFIGEELGEDYSNYRNKVNTYAAELQTQYARMSNQQKLEFVIERTREYLEAAGLERQIAALDRLLKMEDLTSNTVKVGQIAMAEFEDDDNNPLTTTLGCYSSASFPYSYNEYETGHFGYDTDSIDAAGNVEDLGLTLNIVLLGQKWYQLVNVLVHELTHATAYSYFPDPPYIDAGGGQGYPRLTQTELTWLYDNGYLEKQYYDYCIDNWSNFFDLELPNSKGNAYEYVLYLLSCQSGEYAAYQADADYVDSIGGDLLGQYVFSTAVNGTQEKATIENHIETYYNTVDEKEALPEYKWWTYDGTIA